MEQQTDPFNLPFEDVISKNGVILQAWGEGDPLVVIPGLEGSGESCLHLLVPAIEQLKAQGIAIRLCLVNYGKEKHKQIDQLDHTIQELLEQEYGNKELLFFSQSFGNLLAARIARRGKIRIKRMFMSSPFKKMPALKIRLSYYSLFVTPTWLYRIMIKPLGRFTFGPTGKSGRKHPFFDVLARGIVPDVKRQTSWLLSLDYAATYPGVKVPVTVLLGRKDRLVSIKKEIAYFESLASAHADWQLLLNANNGHVIFLPNEVDWVKGKLVKFITG